jgi:ABC-type multidrug transport system ATPase subunit
LGHNGAGKTTTLSMLNGLIEKNEGRAEVHGEDIFENQDYLRQNLGVCPQHDILFKALTPKDHLKMFASFKGTPSDKVDE